MRYKVIVNPTAGKGLAGRSVPRIRALLAAQGLDFDLVHTRQPREAIDLTRQAVTEGYDTVVAVGGDGTCQEVVNGLVAAHGDAGSEDGHVTGTLGLLSLGSGGDFAWKMGIPESLEEACVRLARHETKVVDVGWMDIDGETRFFDNTVGIGFEGVVATEVRKIKYLRGLALYLPAVLKSIFLTLRSAQAAIEYWCDGEMRRLEDKFMLISVCNGTRAGGAFLIAPEAEVDDGMLDICVAPEVPRTRMLALLPYFLKGTHAEQPEVTMLRAERITVTSQDNLIAHADGELVCDKARRIEFRIVPKRLRVVC
jgi:YegS/Rv2252/BmrU family lipid kinase